MFSRLANKVDKNLAMEKPLFDGIQFFVSVLFNSNMGR